MQLHRGAGCSAQRWRHGLGGGRRSCRCPLPGSDGREQRRQAQLRCQRGCGLAGEEALMRAAPLRQQQLLPARPPRAGPRPRLPRRLAPTAGCPGGPAACRSWRRCRQTGWLPWVGRPGAWCTARPLWGAGPGPAAAAAAVRSQPASPLSRQAQLGGRHFHLIGRPSGAAALLACARALRSSAGQPRTTRQTPSEGWRAAPAGRPRGHPPRSGGTPPGRPRRASSPAPAPPAAAARAGILRLGCWSPALSLPARPATGGPRGLQQSKGLQQSIQPAPPRTSVTTSQSTTPAAARRRGRVLSNSFHIGRRCALDFTCTAQDCERG